MENQALDHFTLISEISFRLAVVPANDSRFLLRIPDLTFVQF